MASQMVVALPLIANALKKTRMLLVKIPLFFFDLAVVCDKIKEKLFVG